MIILVCGPDSYQASKKLIELRDGFIKKYDETRLNTVIYDGESTPFADIKQAVLSAPFLASRRLIIIKNFTRGDYDLEEVSKILKTKAQDNTVIIYEGKADKNLEKIVKVIQPAHQYKFDYLGEKQLLELVYKIAKQDGLNVNREETSKIIDFCGNDLWKITSEVKKFSMLKNETSDQLADIKNVLNGLGETNLFHFIDEVFGKNKSIAISLLRKELEKGTAPEQIFGLIVRQVRILLAFKSDKNSKMSAQAFGLRPFVAEKAKKIAKGFDLDNLYKIYAKLLTLDLFIKNSVTKTENLLTKFILEICV